MLANPTGSYDVKDKGFGEGHLSAGSPPKILMTLGKDETRFLPDQPLHSLEVAASCLQHKREVGCDGSF